MSPRPKIPIKVQREVLFEARHRCAVCCEPTPLERAHVIAWSKSRDHSAANLVALCANCHTRADNEHWGAELLRRYKQNPCALLAHAMPAISAEQRAIVDMVIGSDPDAMTEPQRLRFVSMMAAFARAQIGEIRILSVTQANSSLLRLEAPISVANRIFEAFTQGDPLLAAFLEDFQLLRVEVEAPTSDSSSQARTSDVSEKGLETLIVRYLAGADGLSVKPNSVALRPPPFGGTGYTAGSPQDYDRAHALDVPQLFAFLRATQPEAFKKLALLDEADSRDINRHKFLARLSSEIGRRGLVDVLRKGVEHGPLRFDLFYGTPSPGNAKAEIASRTEPLLSYTPTCLQRR